MISKTHNDTLKQIMKDFCSKMFEENYAKITIDVRSHLNFANGL